MQMRPAGPNNLAGDQRGFALIDVSVTIAIIAVLCAIVFLSLGSSAGMTRAAGAQFQAAIAEARALAAVTDDGFVDSGATVGVRRDAGDTIVTVYRYRPIAGATKLPQHEPSAPELHTPVEISYGDARGFAIFISSSGHSSAQAGFTVGNATLSTEPACITATGSPIRFSHRGDVQTYQISCEQTHLDLNPPADFGAK